jgi:hypothetical protein
MKRRCFNSKSKAWYFLSLPILFILEIIIFPFTTCLFISTYIHNKINYLNLKAIGTLNAIVTSVEKGKPTVKLGRKAMGLQYEESQVTKYLNDMTAPTGHIEVQVKLRHSS